jgi:hypothetical protein
VILIPKMILARPPAAYPERWAAGKFGNMPKLWTHNNRKIVLVAEIVY